MTDREMIVSLGERINRLMGKISALEDAVMALRPVDSLDDAHELKVPMMLTLIEAETTHQQAFLLRSAKLEAAIPPEASTPQLLKALYGFVFE